MSKVSKTTIQLHERKVPTIQEIYDDTDLAIKLDDLNVLLNQEPPASWVKVNKFAGNSRYLPIEKVEWLLRRIFKQTRIEITGQGTAFNGVWVTVRVHYLHPITKEWQFHDGIGAEALQVKSGSSPSDLANLNKGALAMAFPLAKSQAVKDACDHFGRAFGSDLNRKDVLAYSQDEKLHDVKKQKEIDRLLELINRASDKDSLRELKEHIQLQDDDELLKKYYSKLLTFGIFRGEYKEEAVYYDLDCVTHNKSMFIANNPNEEPLSFEITNSNFWEEAPFYNSETEPESHD